MTVRSVAISPIRLAAVVWFSAGVETLVLVGVGLERETDALGAWLIASTYLFFVSIAPALAFAWLIPKSGRFADKAIVRVITSIFVIGVFATASWRLVLLGEFSPIE